jgi:malate dehydrogenase (oxaloacetate-decarboxylating)
MQDTPTAAFSLRLRVRLDNRPGTLGRLAVALGTIEANITAIEGFEAKSAVLEQDVVVNARDLDHQEAILQAVRDLEGVELLESWDRTFAMHQGGKIEVNTLAPVGDVHDLSMAYTPGVARVCKAIAADRDKVFDLTIKKNTVAIVSDGTAVLGLGDIGPEAAMPVMEGKALLFKEFAGVDAFPVCIDTTSVDEIVETVERIAPTFGGINLEDIKAPEAFEVEERLRKSLDIPVFHDDQHGTAIVTVAALRNALKLVDKPMTDLRIVIAGVGAAGVAITKMLQVAGVPEVIGVDRQGAVWDGREGLNASKQWFAENTNSERVKGTISEVMPGADVFIGVSGPDLITVEDVKSMGSAPIVFAMANPDPEIRPELIQDVAAVIATGRSDFPNQINNVLAFPGVFRGALDVCASDITDSMKSVAAEAIADGVADDDLRPDNIVPSVFQKEVSLEVARRVAAAAVADGVARR